MGIAGDYPGVLCGKKEFEVFEADIGAVINSRLKMILLKGQHDPGHGDIVVDDQIGAAGQHHEIKGKIPKKLRGMLRFSSHGFLPSLNLRQHRTKIVRKLCSQIFRQSAQIECSQSCDWQTKAVCYDGKYASKLCTKASGRSLCGVALNYILK